MTYGYEGEEEYIPTPEELAALNRTSNTMSVFGVELTPPSLGGYCWGGWSDSRASVCRSPPSTQVE